MQVTDEIEWLQIYWITGVAPRNVRFRNAVSDPPCLGWQHALVIRGEKVSTIFCPYTFTAYTVSNSCSEMAQCKEDTEYRPDFMQGLLDRNWAKYQGWGFQRDYDTCALFMRKLGLEVPAQIMTGGEEDTRKKGGKEVGSSLKKPVKLASKRGKFLKWFLDGDCTRSVREAMAEFSMTRSNALSYLYMIQKDHGIGYVLVGDTATVTLPEGCDNPFDVASHEQVAKVVDEPPADQPVIEDDDEDSWLK